MKDYKAYESDWLELAHAIITVITATQPDNRESSQALRHLKNIWHRIEEQGGTLPGIEELVFVPNRETKPDPPSLDTQAALDCILTQGAALADIAAQLEETERQVADLTDTLNHHTQWIKKRQRKEIRDS